MPAKTKEPEMTKELRVVLGYFEPENPNAWQPGGFEESLCNCISHADTWNLERLKLVFPEYVKAYEKWQANPPNSL